MRIEVDIKELEQRARFEIACEPLMEYLNKYHNPHTRVIVDCYSAELLSGLISIDKE